ncbi:hypothetical protein D187_009287 [Cystobacter fuscus DSM 2262]|uniref:Uncharacterized protein n=1 Tax=Cystobacter fuscus (strain ATCC 25194 / DSM 2262 / NBRC 100088 / M29) TaxID=1242864 RepID=S9NXU0_CYSF2|nr:hypothetical protein D187_009287 [Cystobacter fuscus DSM 2262]
MDGGGGSRRAHRESLGETTEAEKGCPGDRRRTGGGATLLKPEHPCAAEWWTAGVCSRRSPAVLDASAPWMPARAESHPMAAHSTTIRREISSNEDGASVIRRPRFEPFPSAPLSQRFHAHPAWCPRPLRVPSGQAARPLP